jgi:hypothetical protein
MKKDFSRKIPLTNQKEGIEQREQLQNNITEKGTFLPKPIDYYDIDKSTVNFIEKDLQLEIAGEKVPVFYMTIQKWSEFTKTWDSSDEFKDVKMPFITIVRDPDIQPGNNQDGLFDVAGSPTFYYHKVPTFENGREGHDLYKIPQPTSSDLTYHVRIFTNRLKELNKIQNKIQRTFKSRQYYVDVLGHPMPVILESVGDESKLDDIEARRYYAVNFEMVVQGYIINEDDFEVIPLPDRTMVVMEGETSSALKPKVKKVSTPTNTIFEITYKHKSLDYTTIELNRKVQVQGHQDLYNVSADSIVYKLNGVEQVSLPFVCERGDKLRIAIKRDSVGTANLTVNTQNL